MDFMIRFKDTIQNLLPGKRETPFMRAGRKLILEPADMLTNFEQKYC